MIEELKPIMSTKDVEQINLQITANGGGGDRVSVLVTLVGDKLPDPLKRPLFMSGTYEEVDENLSAELIEFSEVTEGFVSSLAAIKAELKEKEKASSSSSSASKKATTTKKAITTKKAEPLEVVKHELKSKPKEEEEISFEDFDLDDI